MNRYLLPGVVFCGLLMMVGMTIVVLAQDTTSEGDVPMPTLTPTVVVEVEEDHAPQHQSGKDGKGGGSDNAPGHDKEVGNGAPNTPPDNNGQPPETNGPENAPGQNKKPDDDAPNTSPDNNGQPPVTNGSDEPLPDNNGESPVDNGPEVVPPPVSDQPPGNSDGAGPPPETNPGGPPPTVEETVPDVPVVPPPAQDNVPAVVPDAADPLVEITPTSAQVLEEVEAVVEVESTEQVKVADEVPVVVEAVVARILGQVESRARVSVTLTTPGGQIISQAADEGGVFQFEVMEPGEYRLVASAPGSLSRQMVFTLAAGQQLDLPLTRLSAGDLNQDSRIDLNDIMLVAANYNGPALLAAADLNGDSWIDIRDLTIIGTKFGAIGPLPWDLP